MKIFKIITLSKVLLQYAIWVLLLPLTGTISLLIGQHKINNVDANFLLFLGHFCLYWLDRK